MSRSLTAGTPPPHAQHEHATPPPGVGGGGGRRRRGRECVLASGQVSNACWGSRGRLPMGVPPCSGGQAGTSSLGGSKRGRLPRGGALHAFAWEPGRSEPLDTGSFSSLGYPPQLLPPNPPGRFSEDRQGSSLDVHLARVESGASGKRLGGLSRTRVASPSCAAPRRTQMRHDSRMGVAEPISA